MAIAYLVGRLVENGCQMFGAPEDVSRVLGMFASGPFASVDPIGFVANIGHVAAKAAADEGAAVGKTIDSAMTVGALVVTGPMALIGTD